MAEEAEVLECIATCGEVQPHQFEPLARDFECALALNDSDEEEDDEDGTDPVPDPVANGGNVDEW